MTGRLFLKLILAIVAILVVALASVDHFASNVAESTYISTLTRELSQTARVLSVVLDEHPEDASEITFRSFAQALNARITLIAKDGRVLRDSEADAAKMENHAQRPEVLAALQGRESSMIRPSSTLGTPFLYMAIPARYGVLRIAVPLSSVRSGVNSVRAQMLTAVAIAFLPAVLLAAFIARYVSRRLASIIEYSGKLASGQFGERLPVRNDELGVLERKLGETALKLQNASEQIQREHQELEKLERVRKDFVINVSHELRTPLASIQGYTETLLDGAVHEPENNIKFLSIIRANAERLGRLTSDLLTLSRIELKSQAFQFSSFYANVLVQQCLDSIRQLAEKKQVVLVLESAPPTTELYCDAEAVHQILSNLIDNAIKYTPAGGQITVGIIPASKPGLQQIFVRDTGIGIPEEDVGRLFERFYRVDKARSRDLGGTGLGLAIVKHLALSMGGEAGVSSVQGKGSTFWFTLPEEGSDLPESPPVQRQLTVA
ncbi:MAG: hypothetical protein HYZ37_02995 [Candidatus Solibacter usitatus]|nr:hypothetical protein [Candidatus Solibacter usitatus]